MGVGIAALQAEREHYVDKIMHARNQITRCERAYESLREFQAIVSQSQENFHALNSGKLNILSEVATVEKNSMTAQRYKSGMQNILNGIGFKVIGAVYSALLALVSAKLRGYVNEINGYEENIALYEKKIADIDRQIEAERNAEEMARLAVGGGR